MILLHPFRAVWHYIRNTDLHLLFLALCCTGYSLVLINSATQSTGSDRYVTIQAAAAGIGVAAFIIISLIDVERLKRYWRLLLILNLAIQLSVLVLGKDVGGNRSWIELGAGITIQPGEFGKIFFILTLAAHISFVMSHLNHWRTLLGLLIHVGASTGAVLVGSSDMGVALSYLFIGIIMIFAAGLSVKWFLGGLVIILSAVPFVWRILQDYQIDRILVLFDPAINPTVYDHTLQSKIAIGAGQFWGMGYMNGNQTQFSRLPAKRTDFIFSVGAEEFGFVGACLILALLGLLILRLFYISFRADTIFNSVLAVGLGGMFLFQTFENIFMCLGMFPVIGLTLPLFSYGGTSTVTMYTALGIAAGVRMRAKPSWLTR